jgi:hypothetical protein
MALASACSLDARPRDFAMIKDIEVPDSIGATDDLVVSFNYTFGVCDSDIEPNVISEAGLRSYAIFLRRGDRGNCPDVAKSLASPLVYTIPAAVRTDPFTIQFRGPGNVETRTVTWR